MTIAGKKSASSRGTARLLTRVPRTQAGSRPDWRTSLRSDVKRRSLTVAFNAKDELQLKFAQDDASQKSDKENINTANSTSSKVETFKIEEIVDCTANETSDFSNTLIVEVLKNHLREEIVLQFDNEQEFRRTLFTYKYFKMRNRLTHSSTSDSSDGNSSPSMSTKSKSSIDYSSSEAGSGSQYAKVFDYSTASVASSQYAKKFDYPEQSYAIKSLDYVPSKLHAFNSKSKTPSDSKPSKHEYDLMQVTDHNGVMHMSVESKSSDVGEIDGLIYTDVEYDSVEYGSGTCSSSEVLDAPLKPQRRKHLLRRFKGRAPPPPAPEVDLMRGQVVRVGVERPEKTTGKENQSFPPRTIAPVARAHMGSNGYESDREEWRSRSTFSSSAFHSLARPARRALEVYYRLAAPATPPANPPQLQRKPRIQQRPAEYQLNYQSAAPEYIILPQQDKRSSLPQNFQQDFMKSGFQKQEAKHGKVLFSPEYKKSSLGGSMTYLNISSRLYGLTDKLKELGSQQQGRRGWAPRPERPQRREALLLKPVIKKTPPPEGSKRPVARTCSAEPPKKVTFSAFATVQVV